MEEKEIFSFTAVHCSFVIALLIMYFPLDAIANN